MNAGHLPPDRKAPSRPRPRSTSAATLLVAVVSCGGKTSAGAATNHDADVSSGNDAATVYRDPADATSGMIDVPASTPPAISIAGRWAIVGFDDPVGVQLSQTGSVLTGQGCASGAPPLVDEVFIRDYCGDIIGGAIQGRQVAFSFVFKAFGDRGIRYATRATVSTDGTRMAGDFDALGGSIGRPVAWVRLGPDDRWIPTPPDNLPPAQFSFRWTESIVDKGELDRSRSYKVNIGGRSTIWGDFGSFASTEVSGTSKAMAFVAGPVPETDPRLPTRLELSPIADGAFVLRVDMSSGGRYLLRGAPGP